MFEAETTLMRTIELRSSSNRASSLVAESISPTAFAVEASCFSKANAAPFWLEKLYAQFSLEAANRLGERGLRYAKLLGAVRDVLAFRNFQKISQLQKLHGAPFVFLNHNVKVMINN